MPFVWCVAERDPTGRHAGKAVAPFGLQALDTAFRKCRQGKRQARNTQAYEAAYLDRLVSTAEAIAAQRWHPSRTLSFVVSQPKWREINAADFSDRVVHTLLVSRLERLYEPIFIHDSYANRIGKGTHAAVDRLQSFLRRAQAVAGVPPLPEHATGRREAKPMADAGGACRMAFAQGAHYLQLDIANFFNSIHRPTLFRLLQGRLAKAVRARKLPSDEARTLQALCRALLTTDPVANVQQRGPARLFARVPPHKRLGALGPGVGLPVGNLTSQFFANVYLNELDQFIKHTLKARWYVRYVDDFVLVDSDPQRLASWRRQIVDFLAERLRLKLRPGGDPRPASDGVDFLGYIVRPHYRLVRRRVVNRCRHLLREFAACHVHAQGWRLPPAARDRLRSQLASYLGHFRHAAHRRLWQGMQRRHPWLHQIFTLNDTDALALQPRWRPAAPTRLADEWRFFRETLPGRLLLVKVGRQYLAAGADARLLLRHRLARPVAPRPGLPELAALPWHGLAGCRARLKCLRVAHAVVIEEELRRDGRRARSVAVLWAPPSADAPAHTSAVWERGVTVNGGYAC